MTIAPVDDGRRCLDGEPWACEDCGSTEFHAGHRMTDADLEEIVEAHDAAGGRSAAMMRRLYGRCCRACNRLDDSVPLIAGSHAEGEAALRAQPWTCPHCGAADYDVTTPYRDGDLDEVPIP